MPVRYISMRNMQRYWSEKEKTRSVNRLMRSIKSSMKGIQVMIRQMHRSRQLPVSSRTYTHIHWKTKFILLPSRSTTVLKIRSITFIYASAMTGRRVSLPYGKHGIRKTRVNISRIRMFTKSSCNGTRKQPNSPGCCSCIH